MQRILRYWLHEQRFCQRWRRDPHRPQEASEPLVVLERFLPYRLNVLASLTSNALAQIYAERFGLSIPAWRVVATLGQYEVRTARDIAAHGVMHKSTVSRAVSALEQRGLDRPQAQSGRPARGAAGADAGGHGDLRGARPGGARLRGAARWRFCRRASRRPSSGLIDRLEPPRPVASRRTGGRRREALHLFPLLRRLSGADRPEPQGRRLRVGAGEPAQGRAARAEAYRAVNPQGRVPALDVGGAILIQSPAILEYLDEVYPEPPLLPVGRRPAGQGAGGRGAHRLRHPSAQQFRRPRLPQEPPRRTIRPPSTPGTPTGSREGFDAVEAPDRAGPLRVRRPGRPWRTSISCRRSSTPGASASRSTPTRRSPPSRPPAPRSRPSATRRRRQPDAA